MGILKKIPNSELKRISGIAEFVIHVCTIILFLVLGHFMGIKITWIVGVFVAIVYFVGALSFHITRSVFKVIDKSLEEKITEEISVQIEEISKKAKKTIPKIHIPKLLKKKEPKEMGVIGKKVESGGTPIPEEPIELETDLT